MSKIHRLLSCFLIVFVMTLSLATPVRAFDGRGGENVIIPASEVINDDLYVGANQFVLDGTVNGDVICAGQTVTINGTIDGNLIAAAQTVIVHGKIAGDVVAAGAVLFFDETSVIGGDVVGAGYSLEWREGSTVGRDAVLAASQILLAGDLGRNLQAGTGALEISGMVGGDVNATVGEAGQVQAGPPPTAFMPQTAVPAPIVKQGLTIDPRAKIQGKLLYTQNSDLSIPAGTVAGKITRLMQPIDDSRPRLQPTASEKAEQWVLSSVRSLVTLIVLGLFLLWVLPGFLRELSEQLRAKPWPSLGWGIVAYAGFIFLLMLMVFTMILGAIAFGVLTLGGLSGAIVWLGILAIFALILGFVLVTSFVAKIVFGMTLGKWILTSVKSPLANHRFWPLLIGLAITVVVLAILTYPPIPGVLAGLLNFAIILFGLGTLWLWGREAMHRRRTTSA